ncbi:MAG: hypothetical protein Q8Q27_09220, partial [Methylotenera sp.]|nr:hypothetical protein [Methylotenera sp.]
MNDCIELKQDPASAIPEIYQDLVNLDDYNFITNVIKEFNQVFRDKVRSKTALRTVVGNAGVAITFSNKIPDPLAEAIKFFSEPVLKLKRLTPALHGLRTESIHCKERLFDYIVEARQLIGLDDADEGVFSDFIGLINMILSRIQQLDIEKPLQKIEVDVFGAYHPANGVVEIYWLPIAIFCKPLGLSMEALTKVVLIHELAHAFTHRGRDV